MKEQTMPNLARLAFVTLLLVGCGKQVSDRAPDPLLAAGEQAFIGSYKLPKFINANKPVPPVIEILYHEGQMGQVVFRFAKTGQPIPQVR
jgi:hypothetical protein